MQPRQLKELYDTQRSYDVAGTVSLEIGPINIQRPVIVDWRGYTICHFPVDTSDHEVQTVARILRGTVSNNNMTAIYCLNHTPNDYSEFVVLGELVTIPGVVKDNEILATYPEFKGNYDQEQYELIKQMAAMLGGRVENIVYQAYYRV